MRELRAIGIQPDVLLCRAEHALPAEVKTKIGLHTSVDPAAVFSAVDAASIYDVPVNLASEGVDARILRHFKLRPRKRDLARWNRAARSMHRGKGEVDIAIVGKYVDHQDAYKSLGEALAHGGVSPRRRGPDPSGSRRRTSTSKTSGS